MTIPSKSILFAAVCYGTFCAVSPAIAQSRSGAASRQLPPAPAKRPNVSWEREPTLLDVLPLTGWDADANGPLLIISPEELNPYHEPNHSYHRVTDPKALQFSRKADGKYNAEEVAAYYDRKIVRLRTLAVFAPPTMTILNDSHLPKPSAVAGLSSSEKLRLLESTFTDAQWRTASSDAGIGVGDLTEKQQALYLSLLPEPFTVARLSTDPADAAKGLGYDSFSSFSTGNGSSSSNAPHRALAPGDPVTLTTSQREAVRLQFAKEFNWSLVFTNGGALNAGTADHAPDTAYNYQLTSGESGLPATSEVYGGELKVVTKNQLKPSQLPTVFDA